MLKHPEDEKLYLMYTVVSWIDDDGNQVEMVEDRFQSRYVSLEAETGRLVIYPVPLSQSGIGRLSLTDAVTLGFSTAEYKAITLVQWIEDRFIQNEQDLIEARLHPPTPWDAIEARDEDVEADDHSFSGFTR